MARKGKDSYLFRDLKAAAREARTSGSPESAINETRLPRIMLAPLTPGAGVTTAAVALATLMEQHGQAPTLFTASAEPSRPRLFGYYLHDLPQTRLHPLPSWLIPGSMARFLLDKHASGSRWSLVEAPGGLFHSPNLPQPDEVLERLHQRFTHPGVFPYPEKDGHAISDAGPLVEEEAGMARDLHRRDMTAESDDPDRTDSPLTPRLPTGAAASLALDLAIPVVFVMNIRHGGMSALTTLRGLTDLIPGLRPTALILNRVPLSQFELWPEMVHRATGLPVLMTIPELPLVDWPDVDRFEHEATAMSHLMGGHRDAREDVQHNLRLLLNALKEHSGLQIKHLLHIADQAPPLDTSIPASLLRAQRNVQSLRRTTGQPFRVAFAQDRAFSDYYLDNLDLIRELGGEIVPFSPLEAHTLPGGTDGLILGGGPLETFVERLADNTPLMEDIREKVSDGLPVIAEGESFIYMSEAYRQGETELPMLSLIPGYTAKAEVGDDFRSQTGLLSMVSRGYDWRVNQGEILRVYDHHRFRISKHGQAYRARLPGGSTFLTGHGGKSLSVLTGHHFAFGAPQSTARFAELCFHRHRARTGETKGKLQGWKL